MRPRFPPGAPEAPADPRPFLPPFPQGSHGGFLGQIGQKIDGVARRHFFDNVRRLLNGNALNQGLLQLGIVDFLQSLRCRFSIQGMKDGRSIASAQVLEDVRQFGRVQLGEFFLGNA